MEELKAIVISILAIWGGIHLIKLVRITRRNHEINKTLSDEERKKLNEALAQNLNQPPEIAGAFTAIPWWVLPVILLFIAAAIWFGVS